MNENTIKYGPALTWDELADLYPGIARIRPMDTVFRWFSNQSDKFFVHPEAGTIHPILKEDE
jgi:hypothetical protein